MFRSFKLFLSISVSVMLVAAAVFYCSSQYVVFDDKPEAVFVETNGHYEVPETANAEPRYLWREAARIISEDFKCVNVNVLTGLREDCGYRQQGNGWVVSLVPEQYDLLFGTEDFCQSRIREVLPIIVPSGLNREEALERVFQWICDHMEYDKNADEALKADYQSARHCFTDGKGQCATYGYTVNGMVAAIPFHSVTGQTDWDTTVGEHYYLETSFVVNGDGTHAWAAVLLDGVWHHYDVSSFDSTQDIRYLDMSEETLSGPDFAGYALVNAS